MTSATSARRRRRVLVRAVVVTTGLALLAGVGTLAVVTLLRATERDAPFVASCAAGGALLAPDQTANAALVVGTAVRRELPARAGTIGIATAMQESRMRNIDYGDRDSLGMFQQRPSQGWGTPEQVMDPVYAVNIFYDHLVKVSGYTEMAVTEAAQAVQRSAFPDAYAQHETLARSFAQALAGWSEADLTCDLAPFDGDPATVAPAALARLERDLGVVGSLRPAPALAGGSEVVARRDGADAAETARGSWAIAHSAVAAASETGAGTVRLGSWVWERSTGQWRSTSTGEPVPLPGDVVVGY